ncbi:hypothetical protein B0H14DRAFT_2779612 [Mycena olivaceomarginata]|nr:hypothetical protein B0H14DRAFT_2779612 [Mycena olivaceomarginata]
MTVHLWNAESEEAVGQPFTGRTDYATSVAFSPGGRQTASGLNDGTLYLCPIATQSWSFHGGWAQSGSSNLRLWLPSHHRIGFWTPSTKLVISTQQTKLCFDHCVHGEEWIKCYIGQDTGNTRYYQK